MNNILIIKEEDNSFEKYISDNMRQFVVVTPSLKKVNFIMTIIRKIHKRIPALKKIYKIWYKINLKKLNEYDKIIIFDNSISQQLIDDIVQKVDKNKIALWFWNAYDKLPVNTRNLKCFSFDENTCRKFNMIYHNQFYISQIDKIKTKNINNNDCKYDAIFIGTDKGRLEYLNQVGEMFSKININYNFLVYKQTKKKSLNIKFTNKMLTYQTVIKLVMESRCIVELCNKNQTGLTLRTLEALFYNKKIITNNKNIINYNFYNKDRVFILGIDDPSRLVKFIKKELSAVDIEILNQYTFEKWLAYFEQ